MNDQPRDNKLKNDSSDSVPKLSRAGRRLLLEASMRYIISDTHFGHENIIEYTGRPFDGAREMNAELTSNWNGKVDHEDTVLFLGDVRHHPANLSAASWLSLLNGNILVVRGNHDGGLAQNAPVNVVEQCVINHGRYEFYCSHEPEPEFSGWQLHGHAHQHAPFIDWENQRVNVSVEAIGYEPLELDRLVHLLDEYSSRPRLERLGDV